MNTARNMHGGCGPSTAAVCVGGLVPSRSAATEEYDGSSWTTTGNYPAATEQIMAFGTSAAAIGAGGTTGSYVTATKEYDGSTWAANPATLATARGLGTSNIGTNTAAIAAGGTTGSDVVVSSTEEFTVAVTARSVDTS